MRHLLPVLLPLAMSLTHHPPYALAQPAKQPHAGELAAGLRRLGVVGSVLYVAAHPDDENTRLLAHLVGARGLRAGYLSLTRGDGGQNLIGTEQDTLLGLIRTYELLAARRIDGAEQLFTRARDFGYSKSAEETFKVWGKEEVLSDVVGAFRRFRPDVVITRFSTKPPNHGHHTASALLAAEAFAAAADPARFPEQQLPAWKADRLLNNTATWNLPENADLSAFLKLEVGGYDPLLGRSWGEVAAQSRSQHKSQGFGASVERGPVSEYFTPLAGARPTKDPFEGLDFTWKRFPKTEALQQALDAANKGFDPRAPHASLPALAKVRAALMALPEENPWKALKLQETESLMVGCAGLYLDAEAEVQAAPPGEALKVTLTAQNRSAAQVTLVSVELPGAPPVASGAALLPNAPITLTPPFTLPAQAQVSTPYWLRAAPAPGLFQLEGADRSLAGAPAAEAAVVARFTVDFAGQRVTVPRALVYRWTDPVRGELDRAFEVAPAVTATLAREVVMFPNGAPQTVEVTLAAGRKDAKGKVRLALPEGWKAEPAEVSFALATPGEERTVSFKLTPPKGEKTRARMRVVVVDAEGREDSWSVRTVSHEHVPPLTVRRPSEAVLVPLTLATQARRLGYIPGPGDKVAESLQAVGYDVTLLPEERLATEVLKSYDAILVGVRAFNANPRLEVHRDKLLRYVEQGGRLVVQYNTNSWVGPLKSSLGPYPLEVGRDRVTDETAVMTPLAADEPLLARPNALTAADYEGWVQERGLYFASKWDERYRPVFALNDPGEPPLKGALLVARHGKGRFVYTGLAFFRQLPAGVPGAYRLLANLLAP